MTELKKALIESAKKHNLPFSIVEQAFFSQFKCARDIIEALELENVTKETLEELETNFNFKYIGKLYATKNNLGKRKKKGE